MKTHPRLRIPLLFKKKKKTICFNIVSSPSFVKGWGRGENQDFKQNMLVGEIFSEILVGDKKGGIQCFVVGQWGELVETGTEHKF